MKLKTSLLSLLFSTIVSASPISNIVVFGDSLSDNGNLYEYMQHRVPQSPPYYEGRFTNGPVWIEQLADALFPGKGAAHLLDYAFGGAGVSVVSDEDVIFSLNHEIDVYALSHDGKADENSLFVVWIGANNYLALPEDDDATVDDVIGGTRLGLQRLVDMGAKNILVMNLPDLGKTPAAREFDASERLSYLALHHNNALKAMVLDFNTRYPDIKWIQYDVYAFVNSIFTSPGQYGFNNTFDTCYDVDIDEPSQKMVVRMAAKPGKRDINDVCEGYLFFDPVHVTELTHQIVANQVRDLLKSSGVEFSE